MLKIGDKIKYGFFTNITIIGEDSIHFILKDKKGNTKKIYKTLINKYGKLEEQIKK